MKKAIGVGIVAVVLVVTAAMVVRAQVRVESGPYRDLITQFGDVTTLVGPGSTIGVSVHDATSEEATRAKLGEGAGVVVDTVRDGTPAAQAGFKAGDIIVEFDGERVRSVRQLTRLVRETPPGRQVRAIVQRDGGRQTLSVAPQERTSADLLQSPDVARAFDNQTFSRLRDDLNVIQPFTVARPRRLGIELSPLGAQLATYFGVKQGVLIAAVDPESPAAQAGLKAGDVITAVNGTTVATTADVSAAVNRANADGMLELRVMRDRKELTVKASIPRPAPARGDRGGRI